MFSDLSERITERLIVNETIPREDKEIYRYGIQQGMIALVNLGTTIVMISAVLWVMRYVTYSGLICGCLTVISGSMIWFLAPVEDRNKPLDDLEKVVYRKRARGILLFESAFLFVSLLQKWKLVVICMTMVFCVLTVMLLMGRWKNKYLRKG